MNDKSERAFKEWLEVEGIALPIFTALSPEEIDPSEQRIHLYVPDSNKVAGPLYKVNIQVILVTPPHSNDNDDTAVAKANHSSVLDTLRDLFEDFDETSLKTVYEAQTGYGFNGGFFEGEDERIDDDSWVTILNFMFGVNSQG